MGRLIKNHWARLILLSASVCMCYEKDTLPRRGVRKQSAFSSLSLSLSPSAAAANEEFSSF